MRSAPYVKFVFDELRSRGWPVQGKQVVALMVERHLSPSLLTNWKRNRKQLNNPRLQSWLNVLDALGYEIMIVAKEPAE